jgi:hypothetical protein
MPEWTEADAGAWWATMTSNGKWPRRGSHVAPATGPATLAVDLMHRGTPGDSVKHDVA